MSGKTITRIFFILILFMPHNLNSKSQSITVLVKLEDSNGYWERYCYDDKRKEVFDQNRTERRLNPDPIPNPKTTGYTELDRSKYRLIEPAIKYPLSIAKKYNTSGKLEKEEWDTDDDKIMDMYFLYHYNKKNKLVKKQSFNSTSDEPFETMYRKYGIDGKVVEMIRNEKVGDQNNTRKCFYNSKEQLIKIEWTTYDNLHNGYTLYHYKSDLLIREEKHMHRRIYNEYYSYDSNGRIIENKNGNRTLKYQYDKDWKLIRETEIREYPRVTYYYYEGGLPVRHETDFKDDGSIDLISKYYYDENGNLIRHEWVYNDDKIQGWSECTYETIILQ